MVYVLLNVYFGKEKSTLKLQRSFLAFQVEIFEEFVTNFFQVKI